jgi:hypothetical protein
MQELLATFEPITLQEMSGIRLMNRIDTKFITSMPRLLKLLDMARQEYRIQEVDGQRNMHYHTVYFDTPHFDMYQIHQAGHANRQKVRFRTYVDSQLQFLEVKTKNNHGRTKKKRIEVDAINLHDDIQQHFLQQHLHYPTDCLLPAVENRFKRVTLVNKSMTERLTIDTALQFHNLVSEKNCDMEQLVIIELKRDGLCYSPVLEMLRQLRIFPHGFSKYCMGSALTNPHLRVNRFKPKLNDAIKMARGEERGERREEREVKGEE